METPTPGELSVIRSLIRQVRPRQLPKRPKNRRQAAALIDSLMEAFDKAA